MDLFFDESGFTGRALLDPDQPFFSVASSILTDEEAADLLRAAFPNFRGREAKFQALWRRPANRQGFQRLVEQFAAQPDRLFAWVVDKRFCVLQKMIDFLVEPLIHAAGRDFYADAHAVRFSNLVYYQLTLGEEDIYDQATNAYYRFARNPSDAELAVLQAALMDMRDNGPPRTQWFFRLAHLGAEQFHRFHVMGDFADTAEIQLSCVLASLAHWRATVPDDFRILHDDSRNFFAQQEMWALITAQDVPPQFHHGGFGPAMEFPLRVTETLAANSELHPAIQLCDMFAGLVNKTHNPRPEEIDVVNALIEGGLGQITINGLRPTPNFPQSPPRPLNGPDVVDQLLGVIYPERPED